MSLYDKYEHRRALVRLCWNLVADDADCTCDEGACAACEAFQALGYEQWPGAEMAAALLTIEVGP